MGQRTPSRESFIDFSQIMAEAEWDVRFGRPIKAREQAKAWLGVIELNVMTGHKDYVGSYFNNRDGYDPPQSKVIPAAEGISLSEMRFHVIFRAAGSTFVFLAEHLKQVTKCLGKIKCTTSDHRGCLETILKDDRVLVTWSTQCGPLFIEPGSIPPFNTFLLKVDGREHETYRVTTRLVAAFPTEEEATRWATSRSDELLNAHDRNYMRLKHEAPRHGERK